MLKMSKITVGFSLFLLLGCASEDASNPPSDISQGTDSHYADAVPDPSDLDSPAADTNPPPVDPGPPPPEFPDPPDKLGGDRAAKYVLPEQYDPAQKWPLVLVLHGYGANLGQRNVSGGEIQDTYLGISARASELGFIALIPHGTADPAGRQFWNATPACCDFGRSGVDDMAYLLGLLDEVATYFHVDPKRVYLIGHSNGGFMSYRLVCEAGERFAALMSIAGLTFWKPEDCVPGTTRVSVLHVHGTVDSTIPYNGASFTYPGAQETIERWAARNGCDDTPDTGDPLDLVNSPEGPETTVSRWTHCQENTRVELWTLNDVGHIPAFTPNFSKTSLEFLLSTSRP